ncbi:hypothetical protein AKJ16_DCAP04129 [Drosera capensis]
MLRLYFCSRLIIRSMLSILCIPVYSGLDEVWLGELPAYLRNLLQQRVDSASLYFLIPLIRFMLVHNWNEVGITGSMSLKCCFTNRPKFYERCSRGTWSIMNVNGLDLVFLKKLLHVSVAFLLTEVVFYFPAVSVMFLKVAAGSALGFHVCHYTSIAVWPGQNTRPGCTFGRAGRSCSRHHGYGEWMPHWFVRPKTGIFYFDHGAEKIIEMKAPSDGAWGHGSRVWHGVGELNWELAAVVDVGGSGHEIWVMKEYGVQDSWT